uniref:40S ribosomal protein S7 n=1 Tax=Metchnikovella dogieli TaxID=2804710 RepID=A0A896WNP7_9MICR|nr:40S ribosomal protein S7 [Metchnikovella dogieli]
MMRVEEGIKKRIQKEAHEDVTELDFKIASAINNINKDVSKRNDNTFQGIDELAFVMTEELALSTEESTVLIYVTSACMVLWKALHSKMCFELEKRLGGQKVFIVTKKADANNLLRRFGVRREMRKDCAIEDVVFPCRVVGKRVRVSANGKKTQLVFLDRQPEMPLHALDGAGTAVAGGETRFIIQEGQQ